MKYCKGSCVFFVIVYWIVVTTKTKSWTEQRLHFYFCFYTLRQFYCLCVVCVSNWMYVISVPVWCAQGGCVRNLTDFAASELVFYPVWTSSVQLCVRLQYLKFEKLYCFTWVPFLFFCFFKPSSVEAGGTCLAGCCRAVWVTAWNTDCILLGSFV